jgi:hypothetical protein
MVFRFDLLTSYASNPFNDERAFNRCPEKGGEALKSKIPCNSRQNWEK